MRFIFQKHNVQYQRYVDEEVKEWLAANFLLINASKTEAIVFTANRHQSFQFNVSSLPFILKAVVSSLGVRMDSALKLEVHVNYIVRSCFFHLRRLAKVRPIFMNATLG